MLTPPVLAVVVIGVLFLVNIEGRALPHDKRHSQSHHTIIRRSPQWSNLLPGIIRANEIPAAQLVRLTRHRLPVVKSTSEAVFRTYSTSSPIDDSTTRSPDALSITLPTSSNIGSLRALNHGLSYTAAVNIGGQEITLVLDTGSSDTWVIDSSFKCISMSSQQTTPQSDCDFGSPFYTPTDRFQQSRIQDQNFNIQYGDGEVVTGAFGFDSITFAGITVDQQLAVVDHAKWLGDDVTAGLLGLGPSLGTSAYPGNDPFKDDRSSNAIHYKPLIQTIFAANPSLPGIFSVAIERDNSSDSGAQAGGVLAIGGLPPTNQVSRSNSFTSAPLVVVEQYVRSYGQSYNSTQANYAVDVDGVTLTSTSGDGQSQTVATSFVALVDTGSSLLTVPQDIASAINNAFDPTAKWSDASQAYVIQCDAKPPSLSIKIASQDIHIQPQDLVTNFGGFCISNVVDAPGLTFGILGDVFLKNVLAIFNVGGQSMHFAQRP